MFLNCHMHLQWNVVWYGCLIKCLGLCLTIEHAAGLWCLLIDCQLIVCVNALWLVHLNPANEGLSYICCELLLLVICTEDGVTRNVCTCTLVFLSGEANKPLLDEITRFLRYFFESELRSWFLFMCVHRTHRKTKSRVSRLRWLSAPPRLVSPDPHHPSLLGGGPKPRICSTLQNERGWTWISKVGMIILFGL